MSSVVGLVLAMTAEAAALLGRRGWHPAGGQFCQRSALDSRSQLIAVRAGIGWENARSAAHGLVDKGARVLISMGLAGGLSPAVRPGDLIVARRCLSTQALELRGAWDAPHAVAAHVPGLLTAGGLRVHCGVLLSTPAAVLSVKEKSVLLARFGSLAVDLESAAVAFTAAEAGIPWLVCRAVCDPADQGVPAALAGALSPGGGLRPSAIAAGLLRRPASVLDLLRLASQAARARKSLRTAWRLLRQSGAVAALGKGSFS